MKQVNTCKARPADVCHSRCADLFESLQFSMVCFADYGNIELFLQLPVWISRHVDYQHEVIKHEVSQHLQG